MQTRTAAMLEALLAAALFGASAPLAKLLLGEIDPLPLSALLYLGSGILLALVLGWGRFIQKIPRKEAPLRKGDLPWLAGAILAGGVLAPILLLYGLRVTPAATASLLLNFEAVATTLIAVLVFREAISRAAWIAILLVTLASILLSLDGSGAWGLSLGALAILSATGLWGLDNNLTRNISAKDPAMIVAVKGLAAGGISLLLAAAIGSNFPAPVYILGGLLLGSLSYGVSILLFVRALRRIGAARTGALFGVAPLIGVLFSLVLFREPPTLAFWIALLVMAFGTALLLREEHEHDHTHERLVHEHAHGHGDMHHIHVHGPGDVENHSHEHIHEELVHQHDHLPDIHHRHGH